MRRASENGCVDIGAGVRLLMVDEVSSGWLSPVVTVNKSYGCAAKKP